MKHRRKKLDSLLIPLVCWILGCMLLLVGAYPLGKYFEGKLYQAVDAGARVYQVNGEYLVNGKAATELSESETEHPLVGSNYARLIQQDISLDVPIYYGDSDECLQMGLGQYRNGVVPGEEGILLISGHDSTYLRHLNQLTIGQFLTIQVDEKKYYYIITNTAIEDADELSSHLIDSKEQELVLYTCYPIGDLTKDRNQRYIIYGKRYLK